MEIVIKRLYLKPSYTIGRLWVDNVPFCDTLEPACLHLNSHRPLTTILRWRERAPMAVPNGRYRLLVTPSREWGRWLPQLVGVPGFPSVFIRPGNKAADTVGDILLGRNTRSGYVLDSTAHVLALTRKITEAIGRDEDVWVSLRALRQYSTSQRKSPLAGIDSPESERVPLAMMPRNSSRVAL